MPSIRSHFQAHPPNRCTVCLEHLVRLLNTLLLAASLAASAYASKDILGILYPGSEAPPGEVPWWSWCLAALGLLTALASSLALLGTHYRSLALLNAYIIMGTLLMSAQLCCAVAYILLTPAPDDSGPSFYNSQRLQQLGRAVLLPQGGAAGMSGPVAGAEWQRDQGGLLGGAGGIGGGGEGSGGVMAEMDVYRILCLVAFGVEGLTLALTCMLQSFYQLAQNMMEDAAADEAGWEGRQPLLQRYPHIGPTQPSGSGHPGPEGPGQQPSQTDEWSSHMRERYGLDTSQFTYRPGPAAGAGRGASSRASEGTGAGSAVAGDQSRCSIM